MTIQLKRKQQGNIWMYMQSNLKKSQNQAEKLKKLSDVKRKVNFRSSQVEAFRNRKLSDQFLIILNTKIFVLNRKSGQSYIYPLNCCWNEFLEKKKNPRNTWIRLENESVLKLISSLVSFLSRILDKLITNNETRDDNNNRRATPTVKWETNHIKHCEINNG